MYRDEAPGTQLGENLRRMFSERGLDFFNQDEEQRRINEPPNEHGAESQSRDTESIEGQNTEAMSPEALSNMRLEILPQLQYASPPPRILEPSLRALQCHTW